MKRKTLPRIGLTFLFTLFSAVGAHANTADRFGPAVDRFCSAQDGSTPFAAQGCALCHDQTDFKKRVDPPWTWWLDGNQSGNFAPFCTGGTPANRAPTGQGNTYSVNEDATLTVNTSNGVLSNDSDPDGDTLTAKLVQTTHHGRLTLNSNGSFSYTPDANYFGADVFTYRANDGQADSAVITVDINITPANDPPSAANDSYSASGRPLVVAAPGVLRNDTDIDGDSLRAVLVSGVSNGILSIVGDGSFTYTPNTGYSGTDQFTYRANDGTADSGVATVSISVSSTNSAPQASNDSYRVVAGTTLNVAAPGILANDNDAESNSLTAQLQDNVTNGSLTLRSDGSFSYTPTANFAGQDRFTYRASDGQLDSAAASVVITVESVQGSTSCRDADQDGFSPDGGICGPIDCNDTNANINPGMPENCTDGIDNDCDRQIDRADTECEAGGTCLAGSGTPPGGSAALSISSALWDSALKQLRVEGTTDLATGKISVYNAATGGYLGEAQRLGNTLTGSFTTLDHDRDDDDERDSRGSSDDSTRSRGDDNDGDDDETDDDRGGTSGSSDHPNVGSTPCSNCHRKPAGHPAASNNCGNCHATRNWRPTGSTPPTTGGGSSSGGSSGGGSGGSGGSSSHPNVGNTPCSNCHRKPSGHPSTSDSCGACHSTQRWLPVLSSPPTTGGGSLGGGGSGSTGGSSSGGGSTGGGGSSSGGGTGGTGGTLIGWRFIAANLTAIPCRIAVEVGTTRQSAPVANAPGCGASGGGQGNNGTKPPGTSDDEDDEDDDDKDDIDRESKVDNGSANSSDISSGDSGNVKRTSGATGALELLCLLFGALGLKTVAGRRRPNKAKMD